MFLHDALMDAIASGLTEVTAQYLFHHFKKLTDMNSKGVEYLEDDFKVLNFRRHAFFIVCVKIIDF